MYHVYQLQGIPLPGRYYEGSTDDLDKRLKDHHSQTSVHTSQFAAWKLATDLTFSDKSKATVSERYLKTGSGRAFTTKHL